MLTGSGSDVDSAVNFSYPDLGFFIFFLTLLNRKAKRCYQKAYNLDPANEEAGAALCDILVAIGEDVSHN